MTQLRQILILEAIENRKDVYIEFINKYFMPFSEYNSVKYLRQYEIREEVNNDAYIFILELSDNIKDVRQIIKLIKELELDEQLLDTYETISIGINTIIRGSKDKLKAQIEPILKQMNSEKLEEFNKRVVGYFKYEPKEQLRIF